MGVGGLRREYIEAMGRATLAMDDIYEQEGLHVDQAMVEAAIQEKREEGTQVDEEGLAEAVAENVRVSHSPCLFPHPPSAESPSTVREGPGCRLFLDAVCWAWHCSGLRRKTPDP